MSGHSELTIISGGQTGVDRAALDTALDMGIPHAGWCPKGRIAEDGRLHERYNLEETEDSNYPSRTRLNIQSSDATLILHVGNIDGGTKYTYDMAQKLDKPLLSCDITDASKLITIKAWLHRYKIERLNVAGPRESKHPGIYKMAKEFLENLLNVLDQTNHSQDSIH